MTEESTISTKAHNIFIIHEAQILKDLSNEHCHLLCATFSQTSFIFLKAHMRTGRDIARAEKPFPSPTHRGKKKKP